MRYLTILCLLMFTTCAIAEGTSPCISQVKEILTRYKQDNRKTSDIKMYTVVLTDRKITDKGTKSEGPEYFIVPKEIIYPSDLKVATHWEKMGWGKEFPYQLNKEYLLFCSYYRAFPLVFEKTNKNIKDILKLINSGT